MRNWTALPLGLGTLTLELRGIKEKGSGQTAELGPMHADINSAQPNKIIRQVFIFVSLCVCVHTGTHIYFRVETKIEAPED